MVYCHIAIILPLNAVYDFTWFFWEGIRFHSPFANVLPRASSQELVELFDRAVQLESEREKVWIQGPVNHEATGNGGSSTVPFEFWLEAIVWLIDLASVPKKWCQLSLVKSWIMFVFILYVKRFVCWCFVLYIFAEHVHFYAFFSWSVGAAAHQRLQLCSENVGNLGVDGLEILRFCRYLTSIFILVNLNFTDIFEIITTQKMWKNISQMELWIWEAHHGAQLSAGLHQCIELGDFSWDPWQEMCFCLAPK